MVQIDYLNLNYDIDTDQSALSIVPQPQSFLFCESTKTKMSLQPFVNDQFKHVTSYFSGKEQKSIWVLSYFISVALVLVPAPLIEFRYFTIPLVLLIIHSPIMSGRNLLLLSFVYAVVNALTMALFLFRPFHWAHEHGTQRFMWQIHFNGISFSWFSSCSFNSFFLF